jgi:hypothetical protein
LPKQTLNKSIFAKKLHHRTLTPLSEPEVTIPFGAIIEDVRPDRNMMVFSYLSEPYTCPRDAFQSAVAGGGAKQEKRAAPVGVAAPEPEPVKLQFEALSSNVPGLSRARVPGGWLVAAEQGGVAFYPDSRHAWKGDSV